MDWQIVCAVVGFNYYSINKSSNGKFHFQPVIGPERKSSLAVVNMWTLRKDLAQIFLKIF